MDDASQLPGNRADIDWDKYIQTLNNQGIKHSVERWDVIRAEQFLSSFSDKNVMR